MAKNKEGLKDNESEELSKIQAVKELIFGQDIKTFEKEFKEINEHLEDIESKLVDESNARESAIQELEKDMDNRLAALEDKMQTRMDILDNEKADRVALGKMLIDMGKKLQSK